MSTKLTLFYTLCYVALVRCEEDVAPPPRYTGYEKIIELYKSGEMEEIEKDINAWTTQSKDNIWELSGLFEGDMMLEHNEVPRNVIRDVNAKWPGGVVPYAIEGLEPNQMDTLQAVMQLFPKLACVKFRRSTLMDDSWVVIRNGTPGCWSKVGMHGGGQVLNLAKHCTEAGTMAHELLHTFGFYHQQSAPDRDRYINVYLENVKKGKEKNFNKYSWTMSTDFNIFYDYNSIMHYSAYAFSKNGNETIVPRVTNAVIGQRKYLSAKDISKLRALYPCPAQHTRTTSGTWKAGKSSWLTVFLVGLVLTKYR